MALEAPNGGGSDGSARGLRHERMTVAAELAVALHHSRDVGPGTHVGPRAQKTASSGGVRPGVLQDPVPQLVVEHAACPCSGAPLLAIPCLGGGADGVDVTTTRFLLKKAFLRKKEEEEEEKRKEVVLQRKRDELLALLDMPPEHRSPDHQSRLQVLMREYRASKRKRKKKRKRRLPRTSSLFSPRRRLPQWHLQGWSFWYCSSRCVPVFSIGSGMCWLVFLVTIHLALCSSSLLSTSVAFPQVQFLCRLFCLPMKPVAFPQVQFIDKV